LKGYYGNQRGEIKRKKQPTKAKLNGLTSHTTPRKVGRIMMN